MTDFMLSTELSFNLIHPEHGGVPLMVDLDYSADDPFAISAIFHVEEYGADEPIEWIFGRDLLAAGLEGLAGEGDVKLTPEPETGVLYLAVSSDQGHAEFGGPLEEIGAFLQRTYSLVPAGTESEHSGMDKELEDLLRP